MIRAFVYLLLTIFVITFLRAIIGLIGKAVAQLFEPEMQSAARRRPAAPTGGELKQDPVCGVYVSVGTKIRKKVGDQTYYFCSEACRDRFQG